MNLETIIYGLIGLLLGLIGVTIESRKSLKDKKNEGWNYTRSDFAVSSWTLLIIGATLILIGIFDTA